LGNLDGEAFSGFWKFRELTKMPDEQSEITGIPFLFGCTYVWDYKMSFSLDRLRNQPFVGSKKTR
jgi:hypothetical protein